MLIGDQNISIHYPVFVRHFERPVKGDIVTILKGIDFFSFFSIFFLPGATTSYWKILFEGLS